MLNLFVVKSLSSFIARKDTKYFLILQWLRRLNKTKILKNLSERQKRDRLATEPVSFHIVVVGFLLDTIPGIPPKLSTP